MTPETAAALPPAWDTPEHKQEIYECFERVQVMIACGPHGRIQQGQAMRRLRELTEMAEMRRMQQ